MNNYKKCWCGGILKDSIHNEYFQCQNCGTLVSKNQPSADKLKQLYTFDGYWHDYVVNDLGYPSIEERSNLDFKDRIPIWFSILKKFKPDAESVLEIGCAHGGFLYFCKYNGIKNVVGVEVDPKTCEFARSKFNLEHIIPGLFPDIPLPIEKFDVVAGFDVLEHFTDPVRALKKVAEILKDNGVCIFQTPQYKGEDKKWIHFKPDEHLFLFSEQNIYLLFDKAGLDVFEILPGILKEDMFVIARPKISVDKVQIEISQNLKNTIKPLKIGIGLIEHMGDIIACEPVSRYLRSKYPDAHIVWCVREEYKELIDSNPYIDETLVVDCLTEWIYLKENGLFDQVVDLHIHNRICPVCNVQLKNINGKIPITGENYFKFGSLLSAFSRSAGLPVIDGKPNVYIPESVREKINTLKLPPNYVVFHCNSNEKIKDWKQENWIKLAKHIVKNYKVQVVEVGTESILEKSDINFINLCGKTSILETAEVIKRALLFIGVDSGPAHIANAVETFGIVLLGHYRNFQRYNPFTGGYADGTNAELIYNDLGPAKEIPFERVIEAVDKVFNERLKQKSTNLNPQETKHEKRAKIIAFFLPQFHPIQENDKWWGKGFTEWRNVVTAKPLFPGHYQPRIPADLGFYDLRLPEVREMQAELARNYGVDAFCFWHYWFNGKLLLERPILEILESGKPDFQFCLAWANENWTRRWDGLNNEILQEQTYAGIQDHIKHFNWLLRFFKDQRYFKIDNKPVFLIYRPAQIPDLKEMIELWRRLAKKEGLVDLFLIAIRASADSVQSWKKIGFDGEVIFQPLFSAITNWYQINKGITLNQMSFIFDYDEVANLMSDLNEEIIKQGETSFACVTPMWDNTARRKNLKPFILTNSSPETFEKWLNLEIERLQNRKPEYRIVFINAWNEWAEGNYLEPDLKFSHGYLNAVKRAVYGIKDPNGRSKGKSLFTIDGEFKVEDLLQFARKLYSENNSVLADKYFTLSLRYTVKGIANSYHKYKASKFLNRIDESENAIRELKVFKLLASQTCNDIAIMKYNENDKTAFKFYIQLAISYDQNNITARKNYADFLLQEGNVENAMLLYKEILNINPNDVETLVTLAEICDEIGAVNDARFFYSKILEIDPNNEIVKAKIKNKPIASIIIPVFNQLEYTKLAIESIRKYTYIPYELIVVDNASTDGTYQYLSTLQDAKLIRNPENYGFPKAVNQGIAHAEGDYIVILNNDVIVTDKWLERLIEHLKKDNSIGIVGPMSNYVNGIQILKEADKFYLEDGKVNEVKLQKFAEDIYAKNKGEKIIFPRIAGLCMVIKREVIEKIGAFDERFTPGNFEDDDYCLRAVLAGFKIAVAKDVFIHHFGSKSFKSNGIKKFLALLERNKKIFIEKWGADPVEIFMNNKKVNNNEIFIPIKEKNEVQNEQAQTFTLHDS
ncbi:Glycosyltransferase, GT2 family [Candidatus Chrysopegis kryptomonas]|uniref:Glycosyltransferase, GT2 family n=1 Tax=Candidatus Chryseopegocella kryptomonas TaxID=1633643 RepID=A0A0P1MQD4_9BACT|nr:Glycosyltransferase, GT2 family [Candidatus Chrysopegis kryptomonas]